MRGTAYDEGWEVVRGWLPSDLEERARGDGFLRRAGELLDAQCWLRLILMHVAGGLSLEQTVIRAQELGWAGLSAMSLCRRLLQAQGWLADLTQYVLQEQRRELGCSDWPFPYRLRVIDATDISEPGSVGIDWRLHYSIGLPELVCDYYELTDARSAEKLGRFTFKAGELIMVDAGYNHRQGFGQVLEADAQVLGRWNPHGFPLEHRSGCAFTPLKHLRPLAVGQTAEWSVQFRYGRAVYPLRLCALRKSPLVAAQSRRRLRYNAQRRGKPLGTLALKLSAYVLVLTSAPAEVLSTKGVLDLYRGRWQVELVFKRFKSLLAGGLVPKSTDAAARAWMQAKMLLALLLERVLLKGGFLSPEEEDFDEVSRWRVVLEVRDCLVRTLAPPLNLQHLLRRGRVIALASRIRRPKRPLQMTQIRQIFAKAA